MNRIAYLGAAIAAAMMFIGLSPMAFSAENHYGTFDNIQVHQFGAVAYLDDSGFYGVSDAPTFVNPTNPQPMPDDPATYLLDPSFDVAMLKCDTFRLVGGEGGEGGPDVDPPADPPAPAPEGDPPQGYCV